MLLISPIPLSYKERRPYSVIMSVWSQTYLQILYEQVEVFSVKLGPTWTSETFVPYYNTRRCHNPENIDLKHHRRESFKTRICMDSLFVLRITNMVTVRNLGIVYDKM